MFFKLLFLEKNHAGGPVHIKINLVLPNEKTDNSLVHRNSIWVFIVMADLKSFVVLGSSYTNDFDQELFFLMRTFGITYYISTIRSAEKFRS